MNHPTIVMNSEYWNTDLVGEKKIYLFLEKKIVRSKASNALETNVLFLATLFLFFKRFLCLSTRKQLKSNYFSAFLFNSLIA